MLTVSNDNTAYVSMRTKFGLAASAQPGRLIVPTELERCIHTSSSSAPLHHHAGRMAPKTGTGRKR
eukprot:scaffold215_cov170-Amphora_coffeaeformis.AAC.4